MKAIAIASLTLNLGIIGLGVFGYLNKDKVINIILDKVKNKRPKVIINQNICENQNSGFN